MINIIVISLSSVLENCDRNQEIMMVTPPLVWQKLRVMYGQWNSKVETSAAWNSFQALERGSDAQVLLLLLMLVWWCNVLWWWTYELQMMTEDWYPSFPVHGNGCRGSVPHGWEQDTECVSSGKWARAQHCLCEGRVLKIRAQNCVCESTVLRLRAWYRRHGLSPAHEGTLLVCTGTLCVR